MKLRVLFLLLTIFASSAWAQSLFWTEVGGGKIDTSKFNGASEATILTYQSSPYGIAYDATLGEIFWTDVTGGNIYEANRDGTSVTTFAYALNLPRGIAIDNLSGTVYWVENGSKKILSTPDVGGAIIDVLTSGLSAPTGITVDEKNGNIYWTDDGGSEKYIGKCALNGSGAVHIDSTTAFVSGIAVDTLHSRIYWTEYGTQKRIRSATLDGSDTATVVTLTSSDPRGILVMGQAGLIYWTNYLTNTVESSNLDGSDATLLISSVLNNPLSMFTTSNSIQVAAFEGYPGTALYFDGSTNYVDAGSSSTFNFSGPFTVEAWFKVTSFPYQWDALITKGDDSWRIARSNSLNYLAFSTNGLSNVDMTGTTNVNDGNWHFFAAVYDGSTKTLYVDGRVDAATPVTGTLSLQYVSSLFRRERRPHRKILQRQHGRNTNMECRANGAAGENRHVLDSRKCTAQLACILAVQRCQRIHRDGRREWIQWDSKWHGKLVHINCTRGPIWRLRCKRRYRQRRSDWSKNKSDYHFYSRQSRLRRDLCLRFAQHTDNQRILSERSNAALVSRLGIVRLWLQHGDIFHELWRDQRNLKSIDVIPPREERSRCELVEPHRVLFSELASSPVLVAEYFAYLRQSFEAVRHRGWKRQSAFGKACVMPGNGRRGLSDSRLANGD